jgi:predicted amidohydrolase YtcJ
MSDIEPQSSSAPSAVVIVNARVWTGDARRPWADAVLLRGDRIEAVGSSAEVRKRAGAGALVIDAKGLMLTSPRADGTLVRGAPADVTIIDRPVVGMSLGRPSEGEVVLSIESGRIVIDRDSLAR